MMKSVPLFDRFLNKTLMHLFLTRNSTSTLFHFGSMLLFNSPVGWLGIMIFQVVSIPFTLLTSLMLGGVVLGVLLSAVALTIGIVGVGLALTYGMVILYGYSLE